MGSRSLNTERIINECITKAYALAVPLYQNQITMTQKEAIYTKCYVLINALMLREINAIIKDMLNSFSQYENEFKRVLPSKYAEYRALSVLKYRKIMQISYYVFYRVIDMLNDNEPIIEAGGLPFDESEDELMLRIQNLYYGIRDVSLQVPINPPIEIAVVIDIPVGILVEDINSDSDSEYEM